LAVTAVILYHGYPKILTGGFIGVDIFFVISGFLISRNIFMSLGTGSLFPSGGDRLVGLGLDVILHS